jgi:broad specificity phosphatase PhoE
MTPGENTLKLVNDLFNQGTEHIILLMRHSAREYEPGRHDLLNPLTEEGRMLAKDLGRKLPKSVIIRGYTSPAERCVDTAEQIMAGHKENGGQVMRNRVVEALGVFYVLDQMKMFMAMQAAGGLVGFQRQWFSGELPPDILMPADLSANLVAGLAKEKLKEKLSEPRVDLMVSHDFTLYLLKHQLLGQDSERYPDVIYLDGIAIFERDGRTYIQSHHEAAVELKI